MGGSVVGMAEMERRDDLRTKVYGERTLYDNPWVRLTLVDIEPPDGRRFEHHVVRLQTVALAVVLDEEDRVLMMWRYRFATDEWGWELPGGIVDPGEDPVVTAQREVEEETGWRAGHLDQITRFQPMPGMVDTPHVLLLGKGATRVGEPADAEEAAIIDWIPMMSVMELIQKGQVLGSGSLVGLLYVLADRAR